MSNVSIRFYTQLVIDQNSVRFLFRPKFRPEPKFRFRFSQTWDFGFGRQNFGSNVNRYSIQKWTEIWNFLNIMTQNIWFNKKYHFTPFSETLKHLRIKLNFRKMAWSLINQARIFLSNQNILYILADVWVNFLLRFWFQFRFSVPVCFWPEQETNRIMFDH